eukprot:sb/3470705/
MSDGPGPFRPKAELHRLFTLLLSDMCVNVILLLLFTTALCGTDVRTEWSAVERGVYIPWDMEGTPLQIKTDSKLGSDDQTISVRMADKDRKWSVLMTVKFSSPMQFAMGYCTSYLTDLSVQPPVEVEKVWTITKTEIALIITCNNVEVLNYLFADSLASKCATQYLVSGICMWSCNLLFRNRPNQEILVRNWVITSHVT